MLFWEGCCIDVIVVAFSDEGVSCGGGSGETINAPQDGYVNSA